MHDLTIIYTIYYTIYNIMHGSLVSHHYLLQERLRDHAKAFDGLLSLIPSKMYYGEDTSVCSLPLLSPHLPHIYPSHKKPYMGRWADGQMGRVIIYRSSYRTLSN